jgi:outer membrane protein OmpA-like peptidoglycan-associated protein
MKKQLIALAVAGALAASGTAAAERNATEENGRKELIGLGSGAAIGAIAGGPIGLILGAAFGGWLGDRFDHEQRGRLKAESRAETALAEVDTQRSVALGNEQQVRRLEAQLRAGERAQRELLRQAIDVQVLFRTADAGLDAESERRLMRIAELIRPLDGVAVHLAGHADARGDTEYNERLSAERAAAVREVLIHAGIPASRIVTSAEGARHASAAGDDRDAMALDRRVEMRLISEDESRRVVARQ